MNKLLRINISSRAYRHRFLRNPLIALWFACIPVFLTSCAFPLLAKSGPSTSVEKESSENISIPEVKAVSDASFLPPEGKTLLFIGQDTDSIQDYSDSTGHIPPGVTGYTALSQLSGLNGWGDWGAGPNNLLHLSKAYSNSSISLGLYVVDQLKPIYQGKRDKNIEILIDTLKSFNRPVFLRFGYEFDGQWNRYNPKDYIKAWRYMHEKIREFSAEKNIVMVWQSASYCLGTYRGLNPKAWYPGDEYVDWIGLSYFTPQDCKFSKIENILSLAREKQKPVFIAEASPQRFDIGKLTYTSQIQGKYRKSIDHEELWNKWFEVFFNFIEKNNDVVKAVAYINALWDEQEMWDEPYEQGYWGDSRVQANEEIKEKWLIEVKQESWLQSSDTLFNQLNYLTN